MAVYKQSISLQYLVRRTHQEGDSERAPGFEDQRYFDRFLLV